MGDGKRQNIRFTYCYTNTKGHSQYGGEVFANIGQLPLAEIKSRLESVMQGGNSFQAEKAGIRPLYFKTHEEDDHETHTFLDVSYTDQKVTDLRDIGDFMKELETGKSK
jgi:hypothetical protein